jgi:hypothetical protein
LRVPFLSALLCADRTPIGVAAHTHWRGVAGAGMKRAAPQGKGIDLDHSLTRGAGPMTTRQLASTVFAAVLLAGTAGAALAEGPAAEDRDLRHQGDVGQAHDPEPTAPGDAAGMMEMMSPEMMEMMQGMMMPETMDMMQGMMTPENMEMMQGLMTPEMMEMMQGMMTPETMQMMQDMMGGGLMGEAPGQEPAAPADLMTQLGTCSTLMPVMASLYGDAGVPGNEMLYGMPYEQPEMTPERVRAFLEERLAWHGNPRLAIGEIATAADGSITAEIVTVDGSLVQRLAFNRYPGLFRQITE